MCLQLLPRQRQPLPMLWTLRVLPVWSLQIQVARCRQRRPSQMGFTRRTSSGSCSHESPESPLATVQTKSSICQKLRDALANITTPPWAPDIRMLSWRSRQNSESRLLTRQSSLLNSQSQASNRSSQNSEIMRMTRLVTSTAALCSSLQHLQGKPHQRASPLLGGLRRAESRSPTPQVPPFRWATWHGFALSQSPEKRPIR
mmetsp:Transcript_52690/g.112433  ORF Transcript_52690/g.112433 Transcript_52690/m.112433 type:complete len:201 (+) Transcript_52690:1802-2404(+)